MRKKRKFYIKRRPTFAFVVEGETEVWYLQMLKRNERHLNVSIEPKIPQKKKISDQFNTVKMLAEDYTQVFWLIDLDIILSESAGVKKGTESPIDRLKKYLKTIDKNFDNVKIVLNNPCLEFWFVLHYESTSKFFRACKSAEKQLKKHIKDYQKSKTYYTKQGNDIYLKLKPHLKKAIQHAKALDNFNFNEPNKGISEMYLIFEHKPLNQIIL